MPVNAKGSRRERELLDKMTKEGFIVHRIAGSGKGEAAICDLIAINSDGLVHFVEVKSRKKYFYTKDHSEQLNNMINTAKKCKAKPVLALKLNYKPWQIIDLSNGIPEKITS